MKQAPWCYISSSRYFRLEFVDEVLHNEPYTREEICKILEISVSVNYKVEIWRSTECNIIKQQSTVLLTVFDTNNMASSLFRTQVLWEKNWNRSNSSARPHAKTTKHAVRQHIAHWQEKTFCSNLKNFLPITFLNWFCIVLKMRIRGDDELLTTCTFEIFVFIYVCKNSMYNHYKFIVNRNYFAAFRSYSRIREFYLALWKQCENKLLTVVLTRSPLSQS